MHSEQNVFGGYLFSYLPQELEAEFHIPPLLTAGFWKDHSLFFLVSDPDISHANTDLCRGGEQESCAESSWVIHLPLPGLIQHTLKQVPCTK